MNGFVKVERDIGYTDRHCFYADSVETAKEWLENHYYGKFTVIEYTFNSGIVDEAVGKTTQYHVNIKE